MQFINQILIIALSLIISIFLGAKYFRQVHSYAKFMAEALQTQLMTNDQPYRALEAFLLYDSSEEQNGYWDNNTGSTMPDQIKLYKNDIKRLKIGAPEIGDSVLCRDSLIWNGNSSLEGFLSGQDNTKFLFQPGFSIQASGPLTAENPPNIDTVFNHNPEISIEIACALMATQILEDMLNASIDNQPVVQCYFMSQSGTLYIMGKDGEVLNYKGKFPSWKYFPSRPYFLDAKNKRRKRGYFDNITVPYIDYGGNGLVRTYCICVELPGNRWGMIGVDCKAANGKDHIRKQIKRIDDNVVEFKILQDTTRLIIDPNDQELLRSDEGKFAWINDKLDEVNSKEEWSEFTGQITFSGSANNQSRLFFAIPIGWQSSDLGPQTSILLAEINPNVVQNLWWLIIISLFFFSVFGVGVGLIISQYVNTRKEQEQLLSSFAKIMHDAKTPFAWFNERNEFKEVNKAFADVLGYEYTDDLKREGSRKRTFKEIVGETEEYIRMLKRSENGEATEPRWWTLRTKNGNWIRCWTHGEGVLVRRTTTRDKLHRFGILIEWDKKEKVSVS